MFASVCSYLYTTQHDIKSPPIAVNCSSADHDFVSWRREVLSPSRFAVRRQLLRPEVGRPAATVARWKHVPVAGPTSGDLLRYKGYTGRSGSDVIPAEKRHNKASSFNYSIDCNSIEYTLLYVTQVVWLLPWCYCRSWIISFLYISNVTYTHLRISKQVSANKNSWKQGVIY